VGPAVCVCVCVSAQSCSYSPVGETTNMAWLWPVASHQLVNHDYGHASATTRCHSSNQQPGCRRLQPWTLLACSDNIQVCHLRVLCVRVALLSRLPCSSLMLSHGAG
jgi:hypothetical protein